MKAKQIYLTSEEREFLLSCLWALGNEEWESDSDAVLLKTITKKVEGGKE